jgi:hypothetical protein
MPLASLSHVPSSQFSSCPSYKGKKGDENRAANT